MKFYLFFLFCFFIFYSHTFANKKCEGNCVNGWGILYSVHGVDGSLIKYYEGNWKNGKKEKTGTFFYWNGQKAYEGDWKNDKVDGQGVFYHWNGNKKYQGRWKNGQENGNGIAYDEDENKIYEGEWINGERHGYGITYYKNGTKMAVGRTVPSDFDYNFKGKFYYPNGEVIKGEWKIKTQSISWETPKRDKQTLKEAYQMVNACLDTFKKLESIKIYVNDSMQGLTPDSIKLSKEENCNYRIETNIKLSHGKNEVILVADTPSEKIISLQPLYIDFNKKYVASEFRTALIIGNGGYKNSPLRNSVNDANTMAEELKDLDFEVIVHTNSNKKEMLYAIKNFEEKLKAKGGVGLFYYSGHGVQINGLNYLIPTQTDIKTEIDLELESVELSRVIAAMKQATNRLNILILDACRNNPYLTSYRSVRQGLSMINPSSGMYIAYATAPGAVADDGKGENGLFTSELIKAIKIPGLAIEQVFKVVRKNVIEKSNYRQVPWDNSSIIGEFYFNKP
ncbi:MAG: caspase family protein [Leptospiraceae bacterium]|nr:caspase family protein [Leptospiraceae bacterium]MCP5495816.1 caspase family protein [Leptospiraceae bacterium]